MTPTFWRRMAIVLSVVNVAGAGFAIASSEARGIPRCTSRWRPLVDCSDWIAFSFSQPVDWSCSPRCSPFGRCCCD